MEPPAVDSVLWYDLVALCAALFFCGLFSFLEMSIASLRLFKLKEISKSISKYKNLFHTLEHFPNKVLISILIAYNLSSVTAAAISSRVMESVSVSLNLSENIGFAIGIFITTITILIVDLIPKSLATKNGSKLFVSTLWLTNIIFYALRPLVPFLSKFTDKATILISGGECVNEEEHATSEKEIQFLIDYIDEKGLMERHKNEMLKSIFELGTTAIRDIMVPDVSVVSIDINTSLSDVLALFSKYQFSRIPVFRDNRENIIGLILQKDIFLVMSKNENKHLKDILRPIAFIPESTKALYALRELREQRMHIAIVINEFGGVIGLVSLEDIIEEIVGSISDEYEYIADKIIPLKSEGGWLVDASIELDELEKALNIKFEVENAITLGGFLVEKMQHMPQKGERLEYENYWFQVQQVTTKRINQVLILSTVENVSNCKDIG